MVQSGERQCMKGNGNMKKLLVILAALALLLACSAAFAADRLEGNGYDTPEEAVLAYLDALNRGDTAGMLSTFAIESYAEHMDPGLYTQYMRRYNPAVKANYLPREDAFALSLAVQARYGGLAISLLANEAYEAAGEASVPARTAEEQEALEEKFRQSPALDPAGKVEFVRWVDPAAMTRGQIGHAAGGRSFPLNAYTGAEDLTERAAEIRIGGRTAYQIMTCARYGGRWYNLDFGGRTFNMAGKAASPSAYLWLPTEEEQAEIDRNLAGEYPEESARWEAVQQSDAAGETWPLVSLDVPGITVLGSAEDAAADSGSGIYAEVHFFRNGGGVVTVTAGGALRERLAMDDASGRILFTWYPGRIGTYYENKRGIQVPAYEAFYKEDIVLPDVSAAELTGSELTFMMTGGARAVVRRPETPAQAAAGPAEAGFSGRLEGEGFGSPEEAVMAYIEAMNRGDVRGMLSTFAVESWTEHGDPWVRLEQMGVFNARYIATQGGAMPYVNSYVRSLTARARYGALCETLTGCYMKAATWTDERLLLGEPEDVTAFLEQIRQSPLYELAGNVEFGIWLDPVVLTDGRILEVPGIADSDPVSGGDETAEVAALITVKGRNALQTMRCVRYGDRWYNLDPVSTTAMIMTSWLADRGQDDLALILLSDDELGEIARRVTAE